MNKTVLLKDLYNHNLLFSWILNTYGLGTYSPSWIVVLIFRPQNRHDRAVFIFVQVCQKGNKGFHVSNSMDTMVEENKDPQILVLECTSTAYN
jgi:hypothetical protein